jgi:glutathione synthase
LAERVDTFKKSYDTERIPTNDTQVPKAFHEAWRQYGNPNAIVVMIVHPNETNAFDQRRLEYELWNLYKLKVLRRSLADIADRGILDPNTFELSMYV